MMKPKPSPIVGLETIKDHYIIRTILNKWDGSISTEDGFKAYNLTKKGHANVFRLYQEGSMIRFNDVKNFILGKMSAPLSESLTIQYDNRSGMKHEDYAMTYNFLTDSKVVRFENNFTKIIAETKAPPFDYVHVIKPVFPIILAEYDGGIYLDDFDARINSLLIVCLLVTPEQIKEEGLDGVTMAGYRFGAYGVGYDGKTGTIPVDMYSMARVYDVEGNLIDGTLGWSKMLAVARATLDMLSSPSVKMDTVNVSKINKSLAKKKKEPILPFMSVRWSSKTTPTVSTGTGAKHGVRYDVRGNWATYTKGRLAGRMIWRSPHQRGVENVEYKSKTYEVK